MFDMQAWRLALLVVITVISVGWMSFAIVGLLSRRASHSALVRTGTALESALAGAMVPADTTIFDGWSYRVGARFAGRVRIALTRSNVVVAGPRVPAGLYASWIWVQGLALALVVPSLAAMVVALDWLWLLVAAACFLVSYAVSMGGAGLWPGLGELHSVETGLFNALEFPLESVTEVDIGKGWSKGGLGSVLFPYKAGIDGMAGRRAVSFFAPDERGREVRFAIHMFSNEDATALAALLAGAPSDPAPLTDTAQAQNVT